MVPPPRSLLEGYVTEFQNTIESTRSKVDTSIGISPLSTDWSIEFMAIQIPIEIPDRDLWVQLRQHTIEMQKLLCLTSTFMLSYGKQVRELAQQVLAGTRTGIQTPIQKEIDRYAWAVDNYGVRICCYGSVGESCGIVKVAGTHESRADIERFSASVQRVRAGLEKHRLGIQRLRAELEQLHHQGWGTTTSIASPQPSLTLPIPHEEILDDGLLMISKFQSIIMDAGL